MMDMADCWRKRVGDRASVMIRSGYRSPTSPRAVGILPWEVSRHHRASSKCSGLRVRRKRRAKVRICLRRYSSACFAFIAPIISNRVFGFGSFRTYQRELHNSSGLIKTLDSLFQVSRFRPRAGPLASEVMRRVRGNHQ